MTDENGFSAPFDYDLVRALCERVIVQARREGRWGGENGREGGAHIFAQRDSA